MIFIYSNSSLVEHTRLSPHYNSPRNHVIDTITIHCVVAQCTVETLGEVFANPARRGSSNYGVDKDGRIGLFVEEKDRAWTSDSYYNDHRAVTIEVASDAFPPYAVTDKAYSALIDLCADICRRNNIKRLLWCADPALVGQTDVQNMTVHRWFEATECPGEYLFGHMGDIAAQVNAKLNADKKEVEEDDEDMTDEKFRELYMKMRRELQDNDCCGWSEEARTWAIQNGLVEGGGNDAQGNPNYMWEDTLTREQLVTVLFRFARMVGLA